MILTEVYEIAAIASSLVLWHSHDTRHIIFLLAVLFFREITNKMAAVFIVCGEDIEQEGLNVIVQRLVVQEQLGKET